MEIATIPAQDLRHTRVAQEWIDRVPVSAFHGRPGNGWPPGSTSDPGYFHSRSRPVPVERARVTEARFRDRVARKGVVKPPTTTTAAMEATYNAY